MTLQNSRGQQSGQMRVDPIGWDEIALLVVPQLMLGSVVLVGAFLVKMMGG